MAQAGGPLEVGAERVFLLEGDTYDALPVARLPYWAQKFVTRIDAAPYKQSAAPAKVAHTDGRGPDGNVDYRPLTAPLVREILDDILLDALLY